LRRAGTFWLLVYIPVHFDPSKVDEAMGRANSPDGLKRTEGKRECIAR